MNKLKSDLLNTAVLTKLVLTSSSAQLQTFSCGFRSGEDGGQPGSTVMRSFANAAFAVGS